MRLTPPKFNIPWVAIIVLLVIMILLNVFYFIRVSDKQQELDQQGFRILNKLGNSIKEQDKVIQSIVENTKIPLKMAGSPLARMLHFDTSYNSLYTGDTLHYHSGPEKHYFVLISDFFSKLRLNDFFSNYMLVKNDAVVFHTMKGDISLTANKFDELLNKEISHEVLTLPSQNSQEKSGVIQSGCILKVQVQGKDFSLFMIPVKFHSVKEKWFLGGFIEDTRISNLRRSLPSNVIVVFIIILLFIIFSFPIIKIFISGPQDQLTQMGLSMAGVSLVIGSVLTIVLVSEVFMRINEKSYFDANLLELNKRLSNEFMKESDTILSQLVYYDSLGCNMDKRIVIPDFFNAVADTRYTRPVYKYFQTLSWINSNGRQLKVCTPYRYGALSNVKHREYFINPDKYKREGKGHRFYYYNMVPIISNTTGEWSIAFSIESGRYKTLRATIPAKAGSGNDPGHPLNSSSPKVLVMTSPMYSLKSPVLQSDYSYCLIHRSGGIWYHSAEEYNLLDNLITESGGDKKLKAILNSGSSEYLSTELNNIKFRLYIAPISGTDLYMVTLFDRSWMNSIEALTSAVVILIYSVVFLFLFCVYLLIRFAVYRKSTLATRPYFFSWLLPGITRQRSYVRLLAVNALLILTFLLLMLCFHVSSLNINFILKLTALIIPVHSLASFFVMKRRGSVHRESVKTMQLPNLNLYTLFLLSWLVVDIIIPVTFIMGKVFIDENRDYIISEQFDLAGKINARTMLLSEFYSNNIPGPAGIDIMKIRNQKGEYYKEISCSSELRWRSFDFGENKIELNKAEPELYAAEYLKSIFYRLMSEQDPSKRDPLLDGVMYHATDSLLLCFSKLEYSRQGKKFLYPSLLMNPEDQISTLSPFYVKPWDNLIFWGIIILLIGLLYFLMLRLVNKLFYPGEIYEQPLSFKRQLQTIQTYGINAVLISMHDPVKEIPLDWSFADSSVTVNSPPLLPGKKVILRNLDSGIYNPKVFENNLDLIDKYLGDCRLVILLNKTPGQYIDMFRNYSSGLEGQTQMGYLISRFEKAVSGLPVLYAVKPPPDLSGMGGCTALKTLLMRETRFNPAFTRYETFLIRTVKTCWDDRKDQCKLKREAGNDCPRKEEIILKIEELSWSVYQEIWAALSPEEQFLLWDLAQDSLVNLSNKEVIKVLEKKGILQITDRVDIISHSFRNFILVTADKKECIKLHKRHSGRGRWYRYKIPLILLATFILLFLFITNQPFLSNIYSILVSAGTIIAVFGKITGGFSPAK